MKKLLHSSLLLLLMAAGVSAFAQDNNGRQASAQPAANELRGVVTDQGSGKPLEFATVLLRDSVSGKVVQGGTTDGKGSFALPAAPGQYTLEVAFVGYTTTKHSVKVDGSGAQGLPVGISLAQQDKEIDAVTVTAKRPLIERKIDMLVMNVESLIMAESSTGLELLKQAPGVSVDNDGNITLNGKGVEVWVDGRPTHLSGQELVMLLEGTEGSNVERIEIMANPSSKYDAAGSGGIINIRSKRSFAEGFSGNARLGLLYSGEKHGLSPTPLGNLSLNYRTEKVAVNLSYNRRTREDYSITEEILHSFDTLRRESESLRTDRWTSQSARASVDYFINKKNTVGAVVKLFGYKENGDDDQHGRLYNSPTLPDSSLGSGGLKRNNVNLSTNLNYTRTFDKSGQQLDANANFMRYNNASDQDLLTQFFYNSEQLDEQLYSGSDQHIDIYSLNVDYAHPFNDKMKMELGGKTAQSITDNYDTDLLTQRYRAVDSTLRDRVNDFEYRELISALYANYAWQIDSLWSVKAGLRYENTYAQGSWRSANSTTTHSFNDLFPTLYVGFAPSQNHSFGLSYTRRIQRPSYNQLNPYREVYNYYSILEGNPNLKPAYTNTVRMDYMLLKFIMLAADYSETRNMIFQTIRTLPGNISLMTHNNVGLMQTGSLSLYMQFPLAKWWSVNLNAMSYYMVTQYEGNDTRSFSGSAQLRNSFKPAKTLKIELQASLQPARRIYNMEQKARGLVNFSIQKTFWDNTGTLSLNVDDIFGTNDRYTTDVFYDDSNSRIVGGMNSRRATLSFSYKFGKGGKKSSVRRIVLEDSEESSRVNSGE